MKKSTKHNKKLILKAETLAMISGGDIPQPSGTYCTTVQQTNTVNATNCTCGPSTPLKGC